MFDHEPIKYATSEDIAALIAWLHSEPPFELVGRVICEASGVELGLIQCAHQAGIDSAALGKMGADKLIKTLRQNPHPSGTIDAAFLTKVDGLLKQRNELAHAAPSNRFGNPNIHGFAKHRRPSGEGFEWLGFELGELEALARALSDASDTIQNVVRVYSNEPS